MKPIATSHVILSLPRLLFSQVTELFVLENIKQFKKFQYFQHKSKNENDHVHGHVFKSTYIIVITFIRKLATYNSMIQRLANTPTSDENFLKKTKLHKTIYS